MAGLGMARYKEALAYLQDVARRIKKGEFNSSTTGRHSNADSDTNDEGIPLDTEDTLSNPSLPLQPEPSTRKGKDGHETTTLRTQPSLQADVESESGTQSGQSGQFVQSGIHLGQSGTQSGESGTQSFTQLHTPPATLALVDDSGFEISSPPKSRGRPKQTARAKKGARNKVIATVQDDSDMYSQNLSLENVKCAVSSHPTYASSAFLLTKFKLFEFTKKPRAPIAHLISKLPPTKQITTMAAIVRIFRADILQRCSDKVTALQKKHKNLGESEIAVEITGVGIYTAKTLRTMKSWHKAVKLTQLVDKAASRVDTIEFSIDIPQSFQVQPVPDMIDKLKAIPLLSVQAESLEHVGKSPLGDDTINTVMLKLFGARERIVGVDTSFAGNVTNGYAPVQSMASIFEGLVDEEVLIPVICGKNHWCCIMMDLMLREVFIYDPMMSTYGTTVRAIAEKLVEMLPDAAPRRYRVRPYECELGVQVDTFNCGVYMLLAFEIFTGADDLCLVSRKTLQYLRYRYLCMCL